MADDSQPTKLFGYGSTVTAAALFDKVEVDDTEISITDLDSAQGKYQLSVGEHTVAYTLKDPAIIANMAFNGCSSITSVSIPDSVTSIGQTAFGGCTSLTSVIIPNSVTSISNYAFASCSGLTSVTIGSGVTSIGTAAFGSCTGLTSVIIPNSVASIGDSAFGDCSSLTSITIGNGVTSIGNSAFARCSDLTSIISLAATAPTIQYDTFLNIKTGGTLYVPIGSSGYDTWMDIPGNLDANYSWTKVEQ